MRFPWQRQRPQPRELTLQEAVSQGLVSFELAGLGEGVTSAVRLRLTKLTDEPLTIRIPAGTEFIPVVRAAQGEREGPEAPSG